MGKAPCSCWLLPSPLGTMHLLLCRQCPKAASSPATLQHPMCPGCEPSYNGLWTRPSSLLFSGRESSELRNDFKSLPFLKLITLLLYDPLFLWLPCVIYEHLETLAHKKDNIVEAEMQLIMWCYKEAGRGWGELLHQARQLLRSEMQGRKDKSFEEMEENRKKCEFCSTGSVKAPRCTPAVYLTLSVK